MIELQMNYDVTRVDNWKPWPHAKANCHTRDHQAGDALGRHSTEIRILW